MLQSDEVYQAMRNNPGLPNKDEFVRKLNTKVRARLSVQFGAKELHDKGSIPQPRSA